MKKFLIVAIVLLTSVLTMEAQGYQGNNYRGGRDFSMYANRYDRFGREGVYMGLRLGPSFTTVDSDDKALDGGSTKNRTKLWRVHRYATLSESPRIP